MEIIDYDRTLYYTYEMKWDDLLLLMVETDDDLLAKKIEHLLYACYVTEKITDVENRLLDLLNYVEHAVNLTEEKLSIV